MRPRRGCSYLQLGFYDVLTQLLCEKIIVFWISSFFRNLYEPGSVKVWSIFGKNGQNCPKMAPKIVDIQFLLLYLSR